MSVPVFTHPGQTALTRTPRPPHSAARVRVSPMSPCLLALYAERSATPSRPATEATFTDAARAGDQHQPTQLPAQQERPEQIDLEHAAPLLHSGLLVATRLQSHSAHRDPGPNTLRRLRSAQIVTEAPTSEVSVLRWCCWRRLELVDLAQALLLGGQRI